VRHLHRRPGGALRTGRVRVGSARRIPRPRCRGLRPCSAGTTRSRSTSSASRRTGGRSTRSTRRTRPPSLPGRRHEEAKDPHPRPRLPRARRDHQDRQGTPRRARPDQARGNR
jgi:hypothetical protein